MKDREKPKVLISEKEYNRQALAVPALPQQDSPGGSDVLEARELGVGLSYEPILEDSDVEFNDGQPILPDEQRAQDEETIS